jgi:DNA-binding NarL/FixJ family response regulator
MNIGVVRARLHLAAGAVDDALEDLATHEHRSASVAMQGEFLACLALALACAGRSREAERTANRARSLSRRTEVVAVVPWVTAISALRTREDNQHSITKQALTTAIHVGNLDSVVTAYRAFPQLLHSLARDNESRDNLAVILEQARDHAHARQSGVPVVRAESGSRTSGLSRREQDVLDLVCRGLPNKEIARVLYITEGTVKAHVHHIFRKLGVKSRAEAILATRDES